MTQNAPTLDSRCAWQSLGMSAPVPVDLGTTTLTGLRVAALSANASARDMALSHPVLATVPLAASQSRALGSDFARSGLVFSAPPASDSDEFTDSYGVRWIWADGEPAPYHHPLENARFAEIAGYPRPPLAGRIQRRAPSEAAVTILDAPCPGILETCFALRNAWRFMEDLTDNWRIANALLDWSLETVLAAYEHALSHLESPPDVVLYGDDYGFTGGMFLSIVDFRQFIRPRLKTFLARLRRLCPAPVLFHTCGAVAPLAGDLADLGVEILNLDPLARGMHMPDLRKELPARIVLHGPTDLVAFGDAIIKRDMKSVAILAAELAHCAPAIAAPTDNLASAAEVLACQRAASFVHALDADDWARVRRLGPIKSLMEHAVVVAHTHAVADLPSVPAERQDIFPIDTLCVA